MLGKIVNGIFITPSEDEFKKITITNPSEEQLKFIMGYKDLIVDEKIDIYENQILIPMYEETDTCIIQHWRVEIIEDVEGDSEIVE